MLSIHLFDRVSSANVNCNPVEIHRENCRFESESIRDVFLRSRVQLSRWFLARAGEPLGEVSSSPRMECRWNRVVSYRAVATGCSLSANQCQKGGIDLQQHSRTSVRPFRNYSVVLELPSFLSRPRRNVTDERDAAARESGKK